ncbi:MAG: MATE family efflux transporter [Pseudomonadota bacterium]
MSDIKNTTPQGRLDKEPIASASSRYKTLSRSALWAELRALFALGLPMGLTQLIQFSINTVDVLMIGRIGAPELGAASLGMVFFYAVYLIGVGPAMAITPMVSQALGANAEDTRDARRSVRMGLWVLGFCFPPVLLVLFSASPLMRLLGQPEELVKLAGPYVLALAPGWPFMLGVVVLRNFLAAIDRTRAPLYIIMITTVFNAFLNWVLIYGALGAPRLELVGAGIASSLSHMLGFFLLAAYIAHEQRAKAFNLFERFYVPDWPRLREIARLGWPISITFAFEVMLFNAAVLIMGRIGVNEVAAYQVALNVAALAFMTPMGLSMAGATRVGLHQGAGNHANVRLAAIATLIICVGMILLFAIPISIAPHWVAVLYLDQSDPANETVIRLVAGFLPIAGAFMTFDAIQVAANQCLRGLKDVQRPMLLTGISYWALGFPTAYWLGLHTSLGANGVWVGLLVGLAAAAISLGSRLWRLTQIDVRLDPAST